MSSQHFVTRHDIITNYIMSWKHVNTAACHYNMLLSHHVSAANHHAAWYHPNMSSHHVMKAFHYSITYHHIMPSQHVIAEMHVITLFYRITSCHHSMSTQKNILSQHIISDSFGAPDWPQEMVKNKGPASDSGRRMNPQSCPTGNVSKYTWVDE